MGHLRGARRRLRSEPPGILSLGRLVVSYFEPIEADFVRYYRTDLRDALWGPEPIGVRRLRALVMNLPLESAFGRGVYGAPGPGSWGNAEELLAANVETTHSVVRSIIAGFAMFAKAPKPKPPRPLSIPRPGKKSRETEGAVDRLRGLVGRVKGKVVYTAKE